MSDAGRCIRFLWTNLGIRGLNSKISFFARQNPGAPPPFFGENPTDSRGKKGELRGEKSLPKISKGAWVLRNFGKPKRQIKINYRMRENNNATLNWDKIANDHKQKYERNYVSCHEPYERDYMIALIIGHFPNLRRSKVERALEHACKMVSTPRDMKVFLACAKEYLDEVSRHAGRPFGQVQLANGQSLAKP